MTHQIGELVRVQGLTAVASVRGRNDHGAFDVWMLFERRLDFSGFDPIAAQFDLIVLASQEFQRAIAPPPRPVTRAIERGAPDDRNVRCDESLPRQLLATVVPLASPSPPRNSSPAMPTGSGCRWPSST